MTELGDLTKRCLGGAGQDRKSLEKHTGQMFKLIDTAKKVEQEQESGTFSRVLLLHRLDPYFELSSTKAEGGP